MVPSPLVFFVSFQAGAAADATSTTGTMSLPVRLPGATGATVGADARAPSAGLKLTRPASAGMSVQVIAFRHNSGLVDSVN